MFKDVVLEPEHLVFELRVGPPDLLQFGLSDLVHVAESTAACIDVNNVLNEEGSVVDDASLRQSLDHEFMAFEHCEHLQLASLDENQ